MQLQTIHVVGRMIGQASGDYPDLGGQGTGGSDMTPEEQQAYDAWAASQNDTATPKPSVGSGWPPARPFVKGAWRVTVDGPRYILQSGDTFAGLAWTYLGDPARWKEIASLNPQHDASHWPAGALIVMPDEAIAYAIRHGGLPEGAGGVDSSLGAGADAITAPKKIGVWYAVGLAVATAAAGAAATVIVVKVLS